MRHYPVLLEWGPQGARRAAERGDAIVIVDVLSFSTASIVACDYYGGALVVANDAELEEHRQASGLRFRMFRLWQFLSNPHQRQLELNEAIVMPQSMGALCTRIAKQTPGAGNISAGGIINAEATADEIVKILEEADRWVNGVTLVLCGEFYPRVFYPGFSPEFIFALEDQIGAGAILSYLPENLSLTPEGQAAVAIFNAAKNNLQEWGMQISSERILDESESIQHAFSLNHYATVPGLIHGNTWDSLRG